MVFGAGCEAFWFDGVMVESMEIGVESLGRLGRHFDPALEDGHRKERRRIGGEPETEIGMRILGFELLENFFQRR